MQAVGTVKLAGQLPSNNFLKHGNCHFIGMDKKGIVIEREMPDSKLSVPEDDLIHNPDRVSSSKIFVEQRGSAI
jgi:hypothetical protein